MINLTNKQARQFILLKHGLLGEYKFDGKQGVLDFIRQTGCIQFDPVDICGKNAELTLQSRIMNFTKDMLDELLYKERKLYDSYDKCLSIIPIEDWPYFERGRKATRERNMRLELSDLPERIEEFKNQIRDYVRANGAVSSKELALKGSLAWSGGFNGITTVTQVVLDYLYSIGEFIIHHKKGTRKYYDLAEKYLPVELLNASDPIPDDYLHLQWRFLRRIGAVGFLWDRPSDAWLYLWNLKKDNRKELFRISSDEGKIIPINIDGFKYTLYCRSNDKTLIETVLQNPKLEQRCELIAPLDPLMWDRKLIKTLFGFEYTWEIYSKPNKRKYGVYVLPLLLGEQFIGRVEVIAERKTKTLIIKNIWYEDGVEQTEELQMAVDKCLKRFAIFNNCENMQQPTKREDRSN